MSEPFIGEIRAFGFHFAPVNWAFCNGQALSIAQNAALFSVLGTTFGGDGQQTFNLPNLQDQAAAHWGQGAGLTPRTLGETFGSQTETLSIAEMPSHNHMIQTYGAGTATQQIATPSAAAWLGNTAGGGKTYNAPGSAIDTNFSPKGIGLNGGGQAHSNVQPLLALNFCIALNGIFPTRN